MGSRKPFTGWINKHNIPEHIIRALPTRWYQPLPDRFSVSLLIGTPLQRRLMLTEWDNIRRDYSDTLTAFQGIATHRAIEDATPDDENAEDKLEVVIDGITIVGVADNRCGTWIRDAKQKNTWALNYVSTVKKLEQQLNMYAWLNRRHGHKIEKLTGDIIYRNWDYKEVYEKNRPNYPKIAYQEVPVKLWTFKQQEDFVRSQLEYHMMDKSDICPPDDRGHRPDQWAVMKKGRKTAVRVLDSEHNAMEYIKQSKIKDTSLLDLFHKKEVWIEKRPGKDTLCKYFCSVRSVCPHAKKFCVI